MSRLSEFLHMGGYAFYVWTSYAIVLVVLILNVVLPYLRDRRVQEDLAQYASIQRQRRKRGGRTTGDETAEKSAVDSTVSSN